MTPSSMHRPGRSHLQKRVCIIAITLLLAAALWCPAVAARDVRVALPELMPSEFTDEQGRPAGLLVDLIEDIAGREGWTIIWVPGSLQESWSRLASGEIDLVMGVVETPERQKVYDFNHEPVLSAWSQVYALPGSHINTILDLEGKRVAMLRGDVNGIAFQDYAKKFGINTTNVELDTLDEVLASAASGDTDAAVGFSLAGGQSANKYGLSETPVMFNPSAILFAVPEGKNGDLLPAIDRYLREGKADPSSTYTKTVQKWFGMKASWVVPSYLWWGLAFIAGLAVLFVVMSLILRREVRRKTAELSRQNENLQSEIASRTRAEEELVRKNTELNTAYEQLTATEEELRENYEELNAAHEQLTATEEELRGNYQELRKNEQALMQARKKLNLLNTLTFQDIQNAVFTLNGYLDLARLDGDRGKAEAYLERSGKILQSVGDTLQFAKKYQDLGISKPRWQSVKYTFLNAISHLDLARFSRSMDVGGLEIYADPLLEDVFFILMENVLVHGTGATEVRIGCRKDTDSVMIILEDNGPGIPRPDKEKIFSRGYRGTGGANLFLAREILSITGIGIRETGEPGAGARFEITVPEGGYRVLPDPGDPGTSRS